MLVNKIESIVLASNDKIGRPTEPTVLLLPLIFMCFGALISYPVSMAALLLGIVVSMIISRPVVSLTRLYQSQSSRTQVAFLHQIVKHLDHVSEESQDDTWLHQVIVQSARYFDWDN